jgi:hypothetical protein
MIKLNLLPAWYAARRLSGQLALLVVVVALGIGAVMYLWAGQFKRETVVVEAQAAELERIQGMVNSVTNQASGELSRIQPITDRLKFFNDISTYNTQYPKLYDKMIVWTYKNVSLSSMTSDGSSVTMQAHAGNLRDFARYMLNMYKATDMFTRVTISNISVNRGGGGGAAAGMLGMAGPAGMPNRPGMGPEAMRGGMPPMPGPAGMAGGPMPGMPPMPGPAGAGMVPPVGPLARPGMPGMPGAGLAGVGATGATGGGIASVSGVDFTVTCTLKEPVANVAPPGTATAAAGGGMGMGMGGGMPSAPMAGPAGMGGPMMPGMPGGMGRPGMGAMPGPPGVGGPMPVGMGGAAGPPMPGPPTPMRPR